MVYLYQPQGMWKWMMPRVQESHPLFWISYYLTHTMTQQVLQGTTGMIPMVDRGSLATMKPQEGVIQCMLIMQTWLLDLI
jgi:hypothetical protein